jgi:hypothetical protein
MAFVRPDMYGTQSIPQNWAAYNQQQPYNPQMQQGMKVLLCKFRTSLQIEIDQLIDSFKFACIIFTDRVCFSW